MNETEPIGVTIAAVPAAATSSNLPAVSSANGTGRLSTFQPSSSATSQTDIVVIDRKIESDCGTTSVTSDAAPFNAPLIVLAVAADRAEPCVIARRLDVENSSAESQNAQLSNGERHEEGSRHKRFGATPHGIDMIAECDLTLSGRDERLSLSSMYERGLKEKKGRCC